MKTIIRFLAALLLLCCGASPLAAALVKSQTVGDIVYFVQDTPGRVDRYDMVNRTWLASIPLPAGRGVPTSGHVDADGLYVAYGLAVYRYDLAGLSEAHLLNAPNAVSTIHSDGNVLLVNHSDSLYAKVTTINKTTNTLITSYSNYIYALGGAAIAPTVNKIFGRTTGVSPSDVSYVTYTDAGTFVAGGDSPYHGDYPSASSVWVFPDDAKIVDSAGIVYSTGDLTYLGSLGGAVNQMAFIGTNLPIALRGNELISYNSGLLPVGSKVLAFTPARIFVNGQDVLTFTADAAQLSGLRVDTVPLTQLSAPTPGAPLDPIGLPYSPDYVFQDNSGNVCLFSKAKQSIFRWSPVTQDYIATIPLIGIPSFATYSPAKNHVYLLYPTGLIRKIDLADPTFSETPFAALAETPWGIAAAGNYVFAADAAGAWGSHYTFNDAGTRISAVEWNYYSTEYIWSSATQRMYFFRDDTSPNDIHSEPISSTGVIGIDNESPLHDSTGFVHPIRVSPDGSIVVLGSGMIHDATTLARLTTGLANSITDAAWTGGSLQTIRTISNLTQFQQWAGSTYAAGAVKQVPGTAHKLLSLSNGNLFAITLPNGIPSFFVMDSTFNVLAPQTLAAPAKPNAALTGASQVTVTWNDITGEQEYVIQRRQGLAGAWLTVGTTTIGGTTFQDGGLVAGSSYFYQVAGKNGSLMSAYSPEVEVNYSVPSAPVGLAANKTGAQQITLSWVDSPNEASYQIDRKTGATGAWTQIATPTVNTVTYVDSFLSLASQYFYRIRAVNALGASANSAEANASTDFPPPGVPTLFQPTAPNSFTVSIQWSNVSYETGYILERSQSGGAWAVIARPLANVVSFTDTPVQALTSYSYRVKATNTTGDSAYSVTYSVTTPNVTPPTAPTNLIATPATGTSARITWTDVANEAGYKLERRADSPIWTEIASLAPNTTLFDDINLVLGTQYFYRVLAFNTGGNSAASNIDDAIPLPYTTWIADDFDPSIAPVWKSILGGVAINGSVGFNGSNALWFGSIGVRSATTLTCDTTQGGFVSFKLRAGNSATDGTDYWDDSETGETLALEYSLNGTDWITLQALNSVAPGFSTWQSLNVEIPNAARGAETSFRWRQLSHSGAGSDTWALDDVEIRLIAPQLTTGPAALIASPNSSDQVTLWWASVDGALEYIVEKAVAVGWTQVAVAPGSSNFAMISGLSPSTFYAFRVRASNPGGTSSPSPSALVRTWDFDDTGDHPGTFTFRFASTSILEDAGSVSIEVQRLDGTAGDIAVSFATATDSADSADFAATSGILSFLAGESTKVIEIPIVQDAQIESDEQFIVRIASPTNGSQLGSQTETRVTILNDDKSGTIAFAEPIATIDEGNATHQIRVVRTAGHIGAVSVSYSLGVGSAEAGSDFAFDAGTLEFADGETEKNLRLDILDDSAPEHMETITIQLSDPLNGALLGAQKNHVIQIQDDEGITVKKGTFVGIVNTAGTEYPSGIVRVTVGTHGSVTGRLTTKSESFRFAGTIDAGGKLTIRGGTKKSKMTGVLAFEPDGNAFSFSCNGSGKSFFEGDGEKLETLAGAGAKSKRDTFNFIMRGEDESANPLRAFGKIRGVSGSSMVLGKFPSGTPFITAASKTISGRIPLFTTTPRNAETLCGWVNIERTEGGDFIAGDLCWSGKQNDEAMLALQGGEFPEPSTGAIIDGFGAEGNAVISFTGGGLLLGVNENVRISANNHIRTLGAATQMTVELTVDRHGCVSGTQQSIGSRPRGVHGIVIPDASGGPSLIGGIWFQGDQVGVWEILPE